MAKRSIFVAVKVCFYEVGQWRSDTESFVQLRWSRAAVYRQQGGS